MSRQDFINTWLMISEMPMGTSATDMFYTLEYNIHELIKAGVKVINLKNGLKKIERTETLYYWYEQQQDTKILPTSDKGNILLGAEFKIQPYAIVVQMIGKRYKGKPPYASDLYSAILKDRKNNIGKNSIRISSDDKLTDEGFSIWTKLLNKGHKISMYNTNSPGESYIKIQSIKDLKKYFKHDNPDFRQYQYILSENKEELIETSCRFNTQRMRELTGML